MSHKPRHQAQSRHRKASSHQGWGILTVRLSSLTEGQAGRWRKKQVRSCTRCGGCKELQRGWLRQHSRQYVPEQHTLVCWAFRLTGNCIGSQG